MRQAWQHLRKARSLSKPSFLKTAIAGVGGLLRGRDASRPAATPQSPEQRADSLFRLGRASMRAGDLERAIIEFDRVLAALPQHAEAIAARAEALDMLGQSGPAGPGYERARLLWREERLGAPDRRYVFRRRGRFAFEVDSYDLALQRVRTGVFPHIGRGNALLVQGQSGEALECYERALKIKPNDPDLSALKGEALSIKGHHLQAIDLFDFALAMNPKDADTLSARAIACTALGRSDEAMSAWRRQFDLLGVHQTAARACVALRMGDYALALPELERTMAKEPGDPYWALYRLAALRLLGRPVGEIGTPAGGAWPVPLFDLHAGRLSADEVMARADTETQRAEAAFQLGVVALPTEPGTARRFWQEVVDRGPPFLIEYAAARRGLAGLA